MHRPSPGTAPSRGHVPGLLLGLALSLLPGLLVPSAAATVAPTGEPPLARIAVLGASVSAGFGLPTDPTGWRPDLATFLDAALTARHEPVMGIASDWMFLDPPGSLREQVAAAERREPTLVVALDALFWFAYGHVSNEERRLQRLDDGLELLDGLAVPLLIGDLPDMSAATRGPMLTEAMVPSPESLRLLNARISAWAAAREHTAVVPMAAFVARLTDGGAVEAMGRRWAGEDLVGLMQDDGLHPSASGMAALTAVCLQAAQDGWGPLPVGSVDVEPSGIVQRVMAVNGSGTAGAETAAASAGPGLAPDKEAVNPDGPQGGPRTAPQLPTVVVPADRLLERIGILGASMSSGFGLHLELGRSGVFSDVQPDDILRAALREPGALSVRADDFFFSDPDGVGERLVTRMLDFEPTLVLAVDHLFWFAYGLHESTEARRASFERGLAQLDQLPCALVVGDVPDMTPALERRTYMGTIGMVPEYLPGEGLRAEFNERLAAWAAERIHVSVFPLSHFVARTFAGEPVEVRGQRWSDPLAALMQHDHMHPSVAGLATVLVQCLDSTSRTVSGFPDDAVIWDIGEICRDVYAQKARDNREWADMRDEVMVGH